MRAMEALERHGRRTMLRGTGLHNEYSRVLESQVQAIGMDGVLARLPADTTEVSDLVAEDGGLYFVYGLSDWYGTDLML